MASLEKHKADSVKWLSKDFEEVHRWLDEFFAAKGSQHRKFRHHAEGVEEAKRLFGDLGGEAAKIHILRDCRNIPRKQEYVEGKVDALGLKKVWPISAYSQYSEEAFSALVEYTLHGPTGILLWGFIGQEIAPLLPTLTRFSTDEIQSKLKDWESAVNHKALFPPLQTALVGSRPPSDLVKAHFDLLNSRSVLDGLKAQFGSVDLAYIPVESLITPLALIDYEYIEALRPELESDSEVAVARFALPDIIQVEVKAAMSPDQRSVLVVSRQKSLMVSGLGLQQTPIGLEARFLITSGATLITVCKVGDRLYLRNGVHRAYLLASLGMSEIPCAVVRENQFSPFSGAYPSFSLGVLTQPRPPCFEIFLTAPCQHRSRFNGRLRLSESPLKTWSCRWTRTHWSCDDPTIC